MKTASLFKVPDYNLCWYTVSMSSIGDQLLQHIHAAHHFSPIKLPCLMGDKRDAHI